MLIYSPGSEKAPLYKPEKMKYKMIRYQHRNNILKYQAGKN